jgi:chromosome partitioning protein
MRLDKPFAFILTQSPPRSPRVDETRAGLAVIGLIHEPDQSSGRHSSV